MKNFFTGFLGALAALWLSFGLLFVLMICGVAVLMRGIGAKEYTSVKQHSVLYLNLDSEIVEFPRQDNFLNEMMGLAEKPTVPLQQIVTAIDRCTNDRHIDGLFIDCNGARAGLAQYSEIREAIERFKSSGKWVVSYADVYQQGDYYLASAADSMFVNPSGMVDIHGLSTINLYFKNLLDKLGVEMQVLRVGAFKSAVEPFILDGPSPEATQMQRLYLDNIWDSLAQTIAKSRKVKTDTVKAWADSMAMAMSPQDYVKNRIVDATVYRHQMLDKLKERTGSDKLNLVDPASYLASGRNAPRKAKTRIGVYFCQGDIVDEGESGIIGPKVCEEILQLAEDDDLDGLVLRVNSPGGSAFASEQIWEALSQWKMITKKPLYVSMSDYAASGGYYISCGADKIFAEPQTLTGSIGIFGLIPNAQGLLQDKIGVNAHVTATNPEGVPLNLFAPMTPLQRERMQTYVNRGYDLFVKRVAEGRHMSVDSVKAIAQGRVWDGAQAKKIGLVDNLGGLHATIKALAQHLGANDFTLVGVQQPNQSPLSMIRSSAAKAMTPKNTLPLSPEQQLWFSITYLKQASGVQAHMPFFILQ